MKNFAPFGRRLHNGTFGVFSKCSRLPGTAVLHLILGFMGVVSILCSTANNKCLKRLNLTTQQTLAHTIRFNAAHFLNCELIFTFHMTDLAPFAMRGILGLGLDFIGEILTYMNSEGCTSGGPSALFRSIKRDRTWELMLLHPENAILHESRRMLLH